MGDGPGVTDGLFAGWSWAGLVLVSGEDGDEGVVVDGIGAHRTGGVSPDTVPTTI